MVIPREKPEPLRLVTLHQNVHRRIDNPSFQAFRLYEEKRHLLTFVRLQPRGRYGDVRDGLRVWAVTVLTGDVAVKVGRKKMVLGPYETAVIQPGPARSISNRAELGLAECLIAEFGDE